MYRLLTHAVRTVSGAHWTQLLVFLWTHAYTVQTIGNIAVLQTVVYRNFVFSERELTFTFYLLSPVRLSVCLSVCRLSSVTFVRPTQAVQIFGNISTALGTLANY